nr:GHKL domain-containing protein [uncultured Clostridium sp.]
MYHQSQATCRLTNGFGLGISSVLETVERYDGVINLYANEKGFHAEVSLPLGIKQRLSPSGRQLN